MKKKKQETNYWKIASIVLMIICLILILISDRLEKRARLKDSYDFGNVEIPKATLDQLMEAIGTDSFVVCDYDNQDCIALRKRE